MEMLVETVLVSSFHLSSHQGLCVQKRGAFTRHTSYLLELGEEGRGMGKCPIMQFPPSDLTTSVRPFCHYVEMDAKSAQNYFKKAPLLATFVVTVSQTTPFISSNRNKGALKEKCPIGWFGFCCFFFISPDLSTSDCSPGSHRYVLALPTHWYYTVR